MPTIPFDQLSDDAHIWIFAADRPITGAAAERFLGAVDEFLAHWHAHGAPLTNARLWRDDRFLVIGADDWERHASGCSIDGLFRVFKALQSELGATMLGGGRVFWRDADGEVRMATRDAFAERAARGEVGAETPVFDTSLTRLGDWRARFEVPAGRSWHAALMAGAAR